MEDHVRLLFSLFTEVAPSWRLFVPCICVPSPAFLCLLYGVCGELIGIYRKSSPGGSVIGQDFRLISSEKYINPISRGWIFVDDSCKIKFSLL